MKTCVYCTKTEKLVKVDKDTYICHDCIEELLRVRP